MHNSKIDQLYNRALQDLEDFFGFSLNNKPKVILVPDRKTIDSLKGKKTEPWVVGWVSNNTIYLLDYKTFESESNHKYSDEKYASLLKHELTHCFSDIVSEATHRPIWLHEGISIFLSGQLKTIPRPEQLSSFIDFYTTEGKEIYQESGHAVEFLVNNYGKIKLLELLKRTKDIDSKDDFAKLFQSIYKFDLKYRNFISTGQHT